MTVSTDDYIALITSEHNQQPNFVDLTTAFLKTFVDNNNLVAGIPTLFDIDTAVGEQLDFVGQWVGLSRMLRVPIPSVYLSLDIAGLGLDQGVWYSPFDPTEGVVSLDDSTYRLMLYIKVAANHWDGSLAQAQQILQQIFESQPGTIFFLVDNFDMSMTMALAGRIPSTLFTALLADGYITLRPAAVLVNTVVTSVDGAPLMGLDVENDAIAGLDVGAWGTELS